MTSVRTDSRALTVSRRRIVVVLFVAAAASLTLAVAAIQGATTSWTRVQHAALSGGGATVYMRDMLASGSGEPWLAVGYLVESDGTRVPSAWNSADGVRWSRTTMPPTASAERRDGPYLVARRGSMAVALGERFDGQVRPAAWYRSAPGAWTALTSELDPLVSFRGRIRALDAGPDGFVAVGVDTSGGGSILYVFSSTDGRSWQLRGGMATAGGLLPFGVSAANGYIVVVGSTASESNPDGRIWVLGPGESTEWSLVSTAPLGLDGPGPQVVTSIDWSPAHGFVAGGLVVRGALEVPALWRSPDGLNWTRLPGATPPNDGGNAAIQRIVAVDAGGFLASGMSDAGPRIWRSGDGASWTAVPPPSAPPAETMLVLAASGGGTLVAVTLGEVGSRLHRRAGTRWVRTDTGPAFPQEKSASELLDVAAAGSRVVAIGQGADERPLVMVSSGGSWQRRAFSDRAGRLLAVTATGGTFWAAGWRLVDGRARLATWTSRNGRRWQRAGGTARHPVGAFVDVAPVPGGVVAVALEPSKRGFVTTAWTLKRSGWTDEGVLGTGDPRAVCVGARGVTAVATRGSGLQSRVVAWTRRSAGRWPRDPELVAGSGASAAGCADARSGTVIVGQSGAGGAAVWRRARPGGDWRGTVLAQTDPASSVGDVVLDGRGFLATGWFGGRGQVDLAVWRSSDGVTWSWLGEGDPVFTEAGYQAGLGLARVGQRVVVVGRHGAGGAGLWISPPSPR